MQSLDSVVLQAFHSEEHFPPCKSFVGASRCAFERRFPSGSSVALSLGQALIRVSTVYSIYIWCVGYILNKKHYLVESPGLIERYTTPGICDMAATCMSKPLWRWIFPGADRLLIGNFGAHVRGALAHGGGSEV